MEALKLYFPSGVDVIIEAYAPYWLNVGQATFVKTLQRIHPNHVRDIWAARREAAEPAIHAVAPVVAELVDYYCELMNLDCASSYAYIPVLFDLEAYSPLAANRRITRTRLLKGRSHSYTGLGPALLHHLMHKRMRGYSGRDANQLPSFRGGYKRLPAPVQNHEQNPQFLYI